MKLREMAICGVVHCFQIHLEYENWGCHQNYGDIWSRNGKFGLLRIGGHPLENGDVHLKWRFDPEILGRFFYPQTLTGDFSWTFWRFRKSGAKRLTIWCEPPGWPDQSDVWPSVQAVRQVDCRIGISWNSRYGNQTWKILCKNGELNGTVNYKWWIYVDMIKLEVAFNHAE